MLQPVDHRSKRIGLRAIVGFAPLAAMAHQPRPLEHSEVLGDGGLRDTGKASQCMNGLFALPGKLLEDGPARGVGERAEDVISAGSSHIQTITVWLWFVKRDELPRCLRICSNDRVSPGAWQRPRSVQATDFRELLR